MSVHPQRMNSLTVVSVLSEFFIERLYTQWVLMNSLSTACSLSEFIVFSRKWSSFSCTFQASKRHIKHAMCAPYSIQYASLHSPNLKLILTKHKNPKNLKLQLKSSTLKFRQEKEKKNQGTYLDGVWLMLQSWKCTKKAQMQNVQIFGERECRDEVSIIWKMWV